MAISAMTSIRDSTEDAFPATPGLTGAELLASLDGCGGDLDGWMAGKGSACHGKSIF